MEFREMPKQKAQNTNAANTYPGHHRRLQHRCRTGRSRSVFAADAWRAVDNSRCRQLFLPPPDAAKGSPIDRGISGDYSTIVKNNAHAQAE
jgi:hypothetical protein